MAKKSTVFEFDGKEYAIMKPTTKVNEDATMEYNRVFSKALKSGALLRESLEKHMREQGLWDDDRQSKYLEILTKINENETTLRRGGIKLSEAKEIALTTKALRATLQNLIAEKNSLDVNTAQGQAESARFNQLLVSCLVYNDTGEVVFDSIEQYDNTAQEDSGLAVKAAEIFASIYFGLDEDYETNLPENKFLTEHKFSDEEGNLLNKDGKKVDFLGRLVDENGRYINDEGEFIDVEGNRVDEEGNIIVEVKPFLDDEGNEIGSEEKPKKKRGRPKKTETA